MFGAEEQEKEEREVPEEGLEVGWCRRSLKWIGAKRGEEEERRSAGGVGGERWVEVERLRQAGRRRKTRRDVISSSAALARDARRHQLVTCSCCLVVPLHQHQQRHQPLSDSPVCHHSPGNSEEVCQEKQPSASLTD